MKILTLLAVLGVIAQVTLGIESILSSRDLATMTVHSSLGLVLLACLIAMYWLAFPAPVHERSLSHGHSIGHAGASLNARTLNASQVMVDLLSLTKPRLSSEVLFTAVGGMWLAPGKLSPVRALVVLLATAGTVGAANALNCYLERDSDQFMARTRNRPLPAGRMEPAIALWFGISLGALSLPALAIASNALTAMLGLTALLSYVLVYTPMKAKSSAAMWVGGIPGALPPLMGWTAVTGAMDAPGRRPSPFLICGRCRTSSPSQCSARRNTPPRG